MFDTSPNNFRDEIELDLEFRRQHTDAADDLIKKYAGRGYRKGWAGTEAAPENHGYEWVSNIRGHLVTSAPTIEVKCPGYEENDQVLGHKLWINDWVHQVDLVSQLRSVAVGYQFAFVPTIVVMEPATDGSEWFRDQAAADAPALRPVLKKIPTKMFFSDRMALGPDLWRYAGHMVIQDKEDMLQEIGLDGQPKFDREAVSGLGVDEGVEEIYRELGLKLDGHTRKQILRYEVYCRDDGMLYTLGFGPTAGKPGSKASYLRPPRKFMGPRKGPYVIFGGLEVPGQQFPLSALAATVDQADDINAHARQAASDAGTAKRIVVVDGAPGVADVIRTSTSGGVYAIPGFSGLLQVVEFGGPNKATLEYIGLTRERLDRTSGLTDTVRGNISGATAEEVHTAQQNRNVRVRDMQTEFRQRVLDVIRLAGWHGWHSQEVEAKGLQETLPGGEPGDMMDYQGGIDPENTIPFDAIRYGIEENSMEFVDEFLKQQQMGEAFMFLMEVSPRILAEPWMRWTQIIDDRLETVNIKNASAKYIDQAVLEEMRMMQQMQAQMAMAGSVEGEMGPGGPAPQGGAPSPGPAKKVPNTAKTEAKAAGAARAGARK